MVMKKKEEMIKLLEQVMEIAYSNLENEFFDFEDFGYSIEKYKEAIEEVE
jgi:hypothetical protein